MLPKNGHVAEIGVFKGDYSGRILRNLKPQKMYLIDPWVNSDDPDQSTSLYGADSEHNMDSVYQSVLDRYSDEISTGQVEVIRAPSPGAMSDIADGSLDFVYIDGDHRYDAVLLDLEISMQKLRPGGYIALDDYMMTNWWKDGVVRALNVFLGAHSDQIMIDRCLQRQVLLRKRDDTTATATSGPVT